VEAIEPPAMEDELRGHGASADQHRDRHQREQAAAHRRGLRPLDRARGRLLEQPQSTAREPGEIDRVVATACRRVEVMSASE